MPRKKKCVRRSHHRDIRPSMKGVPLKCCPCCGSANVRADSADYFAVIWCEDCGITKADKHHLAIAAWNTRYYDFEDDSDA